MIGIEFFNTFLKEVQEQPHNFSKWVKLAVKRHEDDLKKDWKYHFDEKEADKAIRFFQILRHTKNEWAGKHFNLKPFQGFIIGSIFGWKDKDGYRRYRKAYAKVSRKNGKTELAGGIGLYGFLMDGENTPEIYTAATKKKQAKIAFDVMKTMLDSLMKDSKHIAKLIKESNKHSVIKADGGFINYLGKDSDTEDGSNPHFGIIDEYHAHPDSDILKVIETGMGSRRQPLVFIITTAGMNKKSVCNDFERDVCQQVLKGTKKNEQLFCIMFDLDNPEDWTDKSQWIKANPNIGDSPLWGYMDGQYTNAITEGASALRQFQTKNLNVWTTNEKAWFTEGVLEKCNYPIDLHILEGKKCFGGLDLASVRDLTAFVLFFPADEDLKYPVVLSFFFVPKDMAEVRSKKDSVKYLDWIDEGYIIGTPGNVTDYAYIRNTILEAAEKYDIEAIAYDRYNSSQTIIELQQEEINMEPMGQGFVSMNAPTKEIEKMVLKSEINHLDNPVLLWNFDNVVIVNDAAGNMKIAKDKSTEKVDGAVAEAMAVAEWLDYLTNEDNSNAYADHGIRTL